MHYDFFKKNGTSELRHSHFTLIIWKDFTLITCSWNGWRIAVLQMCTWERRRKMAGWWGAGAHKCDRKVHRQKKASRMKYGEKR